MPEPRCCELVSDPDGRLSQGDLIRGAMFLERPVYLRNHLKTGKHLDRIKGPNGKHIAMPALGGEGWNRIESNRDPRYHYLRFQEDSELNDGVVDFKHYFTVATNELRRYRATGYCGRLADLDRADVSHRFASFLARIGFPAP